MFSKLFRRNKSTPIQEPVFVDPINPNDYPDDYIIISNDDSVYPAGLRKYKPLLTTWEVSVNDIIRKDRKLFTLTFPETDRNWTFSANSPIDGIIVEKIEDNVQLQTGQNCCVIKPFTESELENIIYKFDIIKVREENDINSRTYHYRENSTNENKTGAAITISTDEFTGDELKQSREFKAHFGLDDMWIAFSFLEKNGSLEVIIKVHRKHFKLSENSKLYLLFENKNKYEFTFNSKPEKCGKDSDGILVCNKFKINQDVIEDFSDAKLSKWRLLDVENGVKLNGSVRQSHWGYKYREMMITGKSFLLHLNENNRYTSKNH